MINETCIGPLLHTAPLERDGRMAPCHLLVPVVPFFSTMGKILYRRSRLSRSQPSRHNHHRAITDPHLLTTPQSLPRGHTHAGPITTIILVRSCSIPRLCIPDSEWQPFGLKAFTQARTHVMLWPRAASRHSKREASHTGCRVGLYICNFIPFSP